MKQITRTAGSYTSDSVHSKITNIESQCFNKLKQQTKVSVSVFSGKCAVQNFMHTCENWIKIMKELITLAHTKYHNKYLYMGMCIQNYIYDLSNWFHKYTHVRVHYIHVLIKHKFLEQLMDHILQYTQVYMYCTCM